MVGGSIYIVSNEDNSFFCVGSTANLRVRIWQHKNKYYPHTYAARYTLNKLVYYEHFSTREESLKREEFVRRQKRIWKEDLIATKNPDWIDLYEVLLAEAHSLK
jgi:putative endonuclease